MRTRLPSFCALILIVGFASVASAQDATSSPLDVVMKRMKSINAQDLDSFLSTYADDVTISVYPDRPLGSGKSHLLQACCLAVPERSLYLPLAELALNLMIVCWVISNLLAIFAILARKGRTWIGWFCLATLLAPCALSVVGVL